MKGTQREVEVVLAMAAWEPVVNTRRAILFELISTFKHTGHRGSKL